MTEKRSATEQLHERSVDGICPNCHHQMTIHYGLNRCPHCRFIFKSNFKVQ